VSLKARTMEVGCKKYSIRPRETDICVHEGAVYMGDSRHHEILDKNVIAAVEMKVGRGRSAGSSGSL
jgi:hypothetical protein